MANKIVTLPNGQRVALVPRSQLRRTGAVLTARLPTFLSAVMSSIPTPPKVLDFSKGRAIKFPIDGNDQWGDCYYTACAHAVQAATGNKTGGTPVQFNVAKLVARYKVLSGGDYGLSDQQIFPEWKGGIIGPNGPYKILAEFTVDPKDHETIALLMWIGCGCLITLALADSWYQNAAPGYTWDAATPDEANGHAIYSSGRNADGSWNVETWGMDPPIRLTQAGLESCDPEVIAYISPDMFDAKGYAPCGLHYIEIKPIIFAVAGINLPPSPYPAPAPTLVNNAQAVGSDTIPTLTVNQTFQHAASFRNTGTTTWTNTTGYRLGASPADKSVFGPISGRLAIDEAVAPGALRNFSFPIVAPAVPGTYTLALRMVHDAADATGPGWFGDIANATVNVTASPLPPPTPGPTAPASVAGFDASGAELWRLKQ